VDLPHPPEQVFRYLVDPRNRPEWQSSLLSVTLSDRGEPHIGMEWRDNTVTGVIRPKMRITELVPFKVFGEAGSFAGVTAELRLQFTAIPGGCRIRATGQLSGSGPLSSFAARTASRLTPMALRGDLKRAGEVLGRGRLSR
jgi:uncharacterized protein YndB with AHSA1/START domain